MYVACRELRGAVKTSLHESGSWQVGFSTEFFDRGFEERARPRSRHIEIWPRPPEISPGLTLALRIVVPWGSPTIEIRRNERGVKWIPTAPEGHAVQFCVLLSAPDSVVPGGAGTTL